jgi:hypothetical protein
MVSRSLFGVTQSISQRIQCSVQYRAAHPQQVCHIVAGFAFVYQLPAGSICSGVRAV